MMRRALFTTIAILLGTAIAVLLLEVSLRMLPVRETFETEPVSTKDPYVHYRPNRSVTFSIGWNFSTVVKKRSNNYGYFAGFDYDATQESPLVMVIGDSYVEAAQVESSLSMHGRLSRAVEGVGRVYGIGMSGAPLSQYLAFAQFARDEFRPDAIVFVVVGNDFDESLRKYAHRPGQFQFDFCGAGNADWRLVPLDPDPWYLRTAKRSALVRYVMLNAGLNRIVSRIRYRGDQQGLAGAFVGNAPAKVTPERLDDSRCVADRFLEILPEKSGLAPSEIILVIDGMRPHLYTPAGLLAAEASYFDVMRRYLINGAESLGFEVVDMQPVFQREFERHRMTFDLLSDGHWNELAHQLVAREIARSRAFARAFPASHVP